MLDRFSKHLAVNVQKNQNWVDVNPDHRVMLSLTPLALEEIAESPADCGCGKKARSRKKTTVLTQERN